MPFPSLQEEQNTLSSVSTTGPDSGFRQDPPVTN
jgi:hypothetical protein